MAEPRRVVAVLGYSRGRNAGLHAVCAARLAHAQTIAYDAHAVVLSGWARRGGPDAEAELMRAAWSGPQVELVCDAEARSTAENAANVVAAAAALGADELVVVTSSWHRARASLLLRAAARRRGLRVRVEAVPARRSPAVVVRELASMLLLPVHLRRARR